MNNILRFTLLVLSLISLKIESPFFTGKILYHNLFVDLKGNNITDKLAPYLGREQHYFTDGKNYKATDEQGNWVQLYNSESNIYYSFNKDKTAQKIDASIQTGEKYIITKLNQREKIAGYDCNILQITSDKDTTLYYYSSAIKIDSKAYAKHNFGGWNKYLEATDGALPLKFIITDSKNGYVWTAIATQVTKMTLTAKDFAFPKDYQIK